LDLKANGYLSEAVVNFLSLLGWAPEGKEEFLSCAELIQQFTLERVGASPAIYLADKLDSMNGVYIRQLAPDDLARRLLPFYERAGLVPGGAASARDLDLIRQLVPLIQERIKTLREATDLTDFFFTDDVVYEPALLMPKGWTLEPTAEALRWARERIAGLLGTGTPFEAEPLEVSFRALADEKKVKTGQFFGVLRVALTGRTISPPLFETMVVLGSERTLERLNRAVSLLETGSVVPTQ
jgi:glutamyl-tRNA synthetase